jgi:hypothetical protein
MGEAVKRPYFLARPRLITLNGRAFALVSVWLEGDQLMGSGAYADDMSEIIEVELPDEALEDTKFFEFRGKTGPEGIRAFLREI